MKFYWFLAVSACFWPGNQGEGILSRLKNWGSGGDERSQMNEGDENICETVRIMPRIAMAIVGGSAMKSDISAPYIVGIGERASDGSISWFCGGSLISAKHVLTAAHCLVSRNASIVRVGSFSTKARRTENDYDIADVFIHSQYKITESYNDIAVIKLKDNIGFSEHVKPVCIPPDDEELFVGLPARVVGWGAEEFGGEGSKRLKQVEVDVYSNSECEKAYRNSSIAVKIFPQGMKRELLCAGSPNGGKDACQGDSGGPLVLTDNRGIIRQIGIVSTGAGCGFKAFPGVYTRVSSYTQWINEKIQNTNSNNADHVTHGKGHGKHGKQQNNGQGHGRGNGRSSNQLEHGKEKHSKKHSP